MSYFPNYRKGDYWAICDECGFKYHVKEAGMKLRWDGAFVDPKCWEIRQPQDFIRSLSKEMEPVAIIRGEQPDTFVDGTQANTTDIGIDND